VLAILPTGFGKNMIFIVLLTTQALLKQQASNSNNNSSVIVISSLKSIIFGQINGDRIS
jgi:hypothetical protein